MRVLYSADYELFLGENRLPEIEVLVEPTERLLTVCEELGIPMTLFADVACLWRYRELGDDAFPDAVEAQLRDAIRRGHDVQAHLHPHWLHATREDGRWTAPLDTFLVGALDHPAALLARSRDYLEALLQPVDPSYRCVAFRAGNYGLQPNLERVFAALRETGYLVDSSVVPGLVQRNAVNRTDFRGFSPESGDLHGVFEIPIPSHRFGPLDFLRRRLRKKVSRPGRGRTIQSTTGYERFWPRLRRAVFRFEFLELCVDVHPLKAITRRHLAQYPNATFSVSCHPKSVGDSDLAVLREYHGWLRRNYEDVQAVRFHDVAVQLDQPTVYRHDAVAV